MNKRELSEAEICDRCLPPALEKAGWQKVQIRREYTLTEGQIIVRGKLVGRGTRKRADYVLFYHPNQPIALLEAKDNQHSIGAGMQQALGYADLLDVPFIFSSNGDGFLFHDRSGTYSKIEQEIALDRRIQSLTEFKQIIGRGTRLRTDYNKYFFTIIDFRNATHNFEDPDWDGPPIQDENYGKESNTRETREDISEVLVDEEREEDLGVSPQQKYVVGRQKFSIAAERTSYYDTSGKLVTESLRDYTRRRVNETYHSLDEFFKRWQDSDRKQAVIEELQKQGVFLEALEEMVGQDYDPFDLICHVAFDRSPLTRRERAEQVRKRDVFSKYGEKAQAVLDALLEKYADQNVIPAGDTQVLKLNPFTEIGTPLEIVKTFGGKKQYQEAVRELQQLLYDDESA